MRDPDVANPIGELGTPRRDKCDRQRDARFPRKRGTRHHRARGCRADTRGGQLDIRRWAKTIAKPFDHRSRVRASRSDPCYQQSDITSRQNRAYPRRLVRICHMARCNHLRRGQRNARCVIQRCEPVSNRRSTNAPERARSGFRRACARSARYVPSAPRRRPPRCRGKRLRDRSCRGSRARSGSRRGRRRCGRSPSTLALR